MHPFSCRACHRVFGQTDGYRLVLGTCIIEQVVTLICVCGARRCWRRVETVVTKCYSSQQT
jgi:hypothetical protein